MSRLSVVCQVRNLRRAHPSSRGVVPSMVCVCVCVRVCTRDLPALTIRQPSPEQSCCATKEN